MTETSDLITVTFAARRLGMSEPTLRRRVREGLLTVYADPCDRRSRLVRIAEVDVLAMPQRLIAGGGKGDA